MSQSIINFSNSVSYELGRAACEVRLLRAQGHCYQSIMVATCQAACCQRAKDENPVSKQADSCVTLKEATTEMIKHCSLLKVG